MNDHLSPILRKKTLELDYSSIIGVNLHLLTVCQNASMCQTYSPENVFTCRQRTHRMTWKWKEPHCLWTTDVPREPKLMREREVVVERQEAEQPSKRRWEECRREDDRRRHAGEREKKTASGCVADIRPYGQLEQHASSVSVCIRLQHVNPHLDQCSYLTASQCEVP